MSKILKKYKARIFDDQYILVSDKDDALVLDVVSTVDSLMKEYSVKQGAVVNAKKIAVLVALQKTEELISLQESVDYDQIQIERMMQLLANI